MDIIFNFIGMSVSYWQPAYTFFTEILGLNAERNPEYGDWANLGAGWDGYYGETHSLVCELFDQGQSASERWWGRNQNIRPAIHIEDIDITVAKLQSRGIDFTSSILHRAWGKQIEFSTVEDIRWTLEQIPGKQSHMLKDFHRPQFGHVAIRTLNFEAQKDFYKRIFGFNSVTERVDYAIVEQQKPNHPFIILEPGGERVNYDHVVTEHPERQHPFFLSFMTHDIGKFEHEIKRLSPQVIRSKMHHTDWGGTDMVISDVDGNAIQIVQYS